MMTKAKSKNIIERLRKYYGKIDTELFYSNIYELAIAVVLSAQTTDRQVNSVTPALFNMFQGFESLSEAKIRTVESIIKSVGLYKTKAKNIINLSKRIVSTYNNILPDKLENLMELPGIGRKSANVILSIGFKKPAFPVDTHILRISNRMGYVKSPDPYKVEKAVTNYVPQKEWIEVHLLFIKHGRKICSARSPLCSKCPVNKFCDFALHTPVTSYIR